MRILVVGAGAVGQTYGRALQRAGAEVDFLVKRSYEKSCRNGFTLYAHQIGRTPAPERWNHFGVLTSAQEVGKCRWDQVWLCVSSTALKGPWLDELLPQVAGATIVALQPGLRDREYLLQRVPEDCLVTGLITLIAYQTPLPGESLEPGVAYFFPPLAPNPFSGPKVRTREVVDLLSGGGCPAAVHANVLKVAGIGSGIMMPYIAALEAEEWSLDQLARSDLIKTASGAAKESIEVACRYLGVAPPMLRHLLGPALMRPLLKTAPKIMPFDLEVYLKYHFTKVGDQTREMLKTTVQVGHEQKVGVAKLEALLARLS